MNWPWKKKDPPFVPTEPVPQMRIIGPPQEPDGDEMRKIDYACSRIQELLHSMEKPHNRAAVQRASGYFMDGLLWAGVAARPVKKK